MGFIKQQVKTGTEWGGGGSVTDRRRRDDPEEKGEALTVCDAVKQAGSLHVKLLFRRSSFIHR